MKIQWYQSPLNETRHYGQLETDEGEFVGFMEISHMHRNLDDPTVEARLGKKYAESHGLLMSKDHLIHWRILGFLDPMSLDDEKRLAEKTLTKLAGIAA